MKLKYFIPAFMAAVAMFVGCSEEYEAAHLSDLRVSSSFLTLPAEGGSADLTIDAAAAWTINDIPEWLTVAPASGEAGNTVVKFTVAATEEAKEATLQLTSGGNIQEINVKQYVAGSGEAITVAEAIALIKEGKQTTKIIKGIVCKIGEISKQYGNATYFLSDDGTYGENNYIQVYRGYWIDGEKFTTGDEFAVGDVLTVRGTIKDYKGTPEVDTGSEVLSIEKSLLGVESVDMGEEVTELPVEGGDFKVNLMNKGQGLNVIIPDVAKDWLFVTGININGETTVVSFRAAANAGGDRSASIGFSTTDGEKNYNTETTISQKGSIVAASVAEFLAAAVGSAQFRLTGIITSLYEKDTQGKSFTISDWSGEVLAYRVEGFIEAGAKVGDVVTIVGQRGAYNNSPQLVSGTFEKLEHTVTAISIEDFLTKEDSNDVYYMVTGTLDEIANPEYGNLYLKSTESDTRLYVYGCYPGWNATGDNRKNFLATKGIEVGDQLTIIGIKSTHNDAPQLKNGVFFSVVKADPQER